MSNSKIKKYISVFSIFAVTLFSSFVFAFSKPEKSMACSVALAEFTPPDVSIIKDWYKDTDQPEVTVNVIVRNTSRDDLCVGKNIKIVLLEKDSRSLQFTQSFSFSELKTTDVVIPDSNYLSIKYKAGEEECEKTHGDSNDCEYSIRISLDDGTTFNSDGKSGGTLKYDCDGDCNKEWTLEDVENRWVRIDNKTDKKPVDTTFTPLVRLPGMPESFDTVPSPENPCPFGSYVNMIIKVLLGLYAVLAVIMIVKGGIEYMTSEISSSKEGGKRTITNAVLGLVIALSAYLILNTINPKLLDVCFNDFPQARITISYEPETGIGKGRQGEQIALINKADSSTIILTACDESQMETISVFGKNFKIYKGLKSSLERINTEWLKKPISERYVVNSIGGYECRVVKDKKAWSAHAYGLAIDINPLKNTFGQEGKAKKDIPEWFVEIFKKEGWGWGGEWKNVKDYMHFSKYPLNELGDRVIEL